MRWTNRGLLALSLSLPLTAFAQQKGGATDVPLPVSKSAIFDVATKARQPIALQQKWTFAANEEGVVILRNVLRFKLPEGQTLTEPTGPQVRSKNNVYLLSSDSLAQPLTVTDANGATQNLVVQTRLPGTTVIRQRDCVTERIEIQRPKELPAAFFLSLSCEIKGGDLALGLAVPSDWSWRSASLVDDKGKGESWKLFRTKNIEGDLLRFELSKGDKTLSFNVFKKVDEARKQRESQEQSMIELALAMHSASISSAGADARSSSGPGFVLEGRSKPVLGGLFAQGAVIYSAAGSGEDAVEYSEFGLAAGYRWSPSGGFALLPRAGFASLNSGNTAAGVRLAHASISVGTALDIPLGTMVLSPSVDLGSLGNAVASGHTVIGLKLRRFEGFRWSLGARIQSFKTTSASGVERTFGQTSVMLGYLF